MYDLFISYSSHDRPWAERLYNDLRVQYPFLKVFIDRATIEIGGSWRDALTNSTVQTDHFAIFWSEAAKASNEVGPEIEAFRQSQYMQASAGAIQRQIFYIPLEGSYGPLESLQGFPDFKVRNVYKADQQDRGTAVLSANPVKADWERMVGRIAGTISQNRKTTPLRLSVLCAYEDNLGELENILETRPLPYLLTLEEFLSGIGLEYEQAKQRYGETTFDWRPFGTKTVKELMDDLRVETNRKLDPQYQFHWEPVHLVPNTQDEADSLNEEEFQRRVKALTETPSLVLIDPISLYHPTVGAVFAELDSYTKREESLIVWLSPTSEPTLDWVYRYLSRGAPFVKKYFQPQIPASGTIARCGVNLHHAMDLERLVRGSLGLFYRQQKKTEDQELHKVGN